MFSALWERLPAHQQKIAAFRARLKLTGGLILFRSFNPARSCLETGEATRLTGNGNGSDIDASALSRSFRVVRESMIKWLGEKLFIERALNL